MKGNADGGFDGDGVGVSIIFRMVKQSVLSVLVLVVVVVLLGLIVILRWWYRKW